jgi:hypothetical protein
MGYGPIIGDPCSGCDPDPDGNVVGPIVASAIYWTPKYLAVRRPQQGFIGGQSELLAPNHLPRECRTYWHIECFAVEKQFLTAEALQLFADNQEPLEKQAAMRGARPSSQLKILIEWFSARQQTRSLIADIGTGIDIRIGPTSSVTGVLLLPDPSNVVVPAGLAPLALESTATVVTARGTPVNTPGGGWNGTYTQTRYVPADETVLDVIPAFARWVEIYVADPTLADPPTVVAAGTVQASWVFDRTISGGLAPVGGISAYPSLPGRRTPVPGNAKLVALRSASPQLVTIIYGLSL